MKNIDKIEQAAKKANKPVSAAELGRDLKLSRATVAKYLQILSASGKIRTKRIGNCILVV